jgi:hypothetical protein
MAMAAMGIELRKSCAIALTIWASLGQFVQDYSVKRHNGGINGQ